MQHTALTRSWSRALSPCLPGATRRIFCSLVVVCVTFLVAPLAASADIVNPSFEDASHLSGWTTAGSSVFPSTDLYFGVVVSPTAGAWQAVLNKEGGVPTIAMLAPFMGVTGTELASVIGDVVRLGRSGPHWHRLHRPAEELSPGLKLSGLVVVTYSSPVRPSGLAGLFARVDSSFGRLIVSFAIRFLTYPENGPVFGTGEIWPAWLRW